MPGSLVVINPHASRTRDASTLAALGVPRSPLEAVDALDRAEPRAVDLGEVTVELADDTTMDSLFIIGCGVGLDAELMATTSEGLRRRLGAAAHFVHGARLALRLSATPCRVTVDGEPIEVGATVVLIGNMGQLVPGRLDLRLPIDPSDGLLDLIVVGASSPIGGLRGLADQFRRAGLGGGSGDPSIRRRGRTIRIEPERPMPLEVDGDYLGSGALEARIRPGALRVLTPAG